MNQTHLFIATVKTVRLRLKAQRRESGSLNDSTILTKSSHKQTEFAQEAKNVVSVMYSLINFNPRFLYALPLLFVIVSCTICRADDT